MVKHVSERTGTITFHTCWAEPNPESQNFTVINFNLWDDSLAFSCPGSVTTPVTGHCSAPLTDSLESRDDFEGILSTL